MTGDEASGAAVVAEVADAGTDGGGGPQGLALAFELFDLGVRLHEQRFRREHPEAGPTEAEASLSRWLRERPGATDGDCAGAVRRREPT